MRQKLKLTYGVGPTVVFTAKNYRVLPSDTMITSIDGWDNPDNISIVTEQKLIGSGSYVISKSRGELSVKVEINATINPRTIHEAIKTLRDAFTSVKLVREYYADDDAVSPTSTKVLYGLVTSIGNYDEKGTWATIGFTVLCSDPTEHAS